MLQPRPLTYLWMAGAGIFLLAVIHTLSGGSTAEIPSWVTSKVSSLGGGAQVVQDAGGRMTLVDHMKLSEATWKKSVRQRHELLMQDWKGSNDIPLFPAVDGASYGITPYSIWDFVPASYSCPHEMERIGRMGDGGKWVCGMHLYESIPKAKPCVIYSFGVQFESSFEDEMLDRTHCEIWAYDFSVVDFGKQLSAEHKSRAHFTQAGISGTTNPKKSPPFYTIQDLMKINGHDYLDILKIDIEYSEFDSLDSLNKAFSTGSGQEFPIGQMMVEIHLFGIEHYGNKISTTSGFFIDWWEMLEGRGMRPTWTEPNLLYTTMKIEGGGDPRLAEYTLVNTRDSRSVLFPGLINGKV